MNMRLYWLQDRAQQGQLRFFWALGKIKLGDYHSKVQPTGPCNSKTNPNICEREKSNYTRRV